MTWSLRRNTDKTLPASHTIEVKFKLPADFPGGGIANIQGILMNQSEQAHAIPLAGPAVKVTDWFFIIGLSAVNPDVQRNVHISPVVVPDDLAIPAIVKALPLGDQTSRSPREPAVDWSSKLAGLLPLRGR